MQPEVWQPKPQNRYIPLDYRDNVDKGVFELVHFGRTVFRPKFRWADKPWDDIIIYDDKNDKEELINNLHVGANIASQHKDTVIFVIKKCWDSVCKESARHTILDYHFSIDTGVSKPICCRCPTYRPHEWPIILVQIASLLDNDWIEECGGAWRVIIVLVTKPHQEHVNYTTHHLDDVCILSWF